MLCLIMSGACHPGGSDAKNGNAPVYEKLLMDRFPLSLDALFRTDDAAGREAMLASIRQGRPEATSQFLVPYPNYNHVAHFPATLKWYLYAAGAAPVSLPLAGFLEVSGDAGAATQELNGMTEVMDISATIHLSYYIRVKLQHACIDKTLVDAFHAAAPVDVFGQTRQAIPVAANTVLGSKKPAGALDFIIEDDTHHNFDPDAAGSNFQSWPNPFFYFTPEVQEQLRVAYQPQLDAMKESGLYPESALDRTFDINESGTFFGTWFYESGPLQPGASDHPYGWYSFSGSILNLLNVAHTDRATFWKDANTGLPFGSEMIGVYCDALVAGTVPAYTPVGGRYMVQVAGDTQNGIVRLDAFFYAQGALPVYLKVQWLGGTAPSMWDDKLVAEVFPTIEAAQGSFTAAKSTYARRYDLHN